MKLRRLQIHLGYLIPLLILFSLNVSHPEAQGANFWSEQEKIPEYYDYTEEPPFLIADRNHTVYAFNSQPLDLRNPDSQKAIFYRQWTIENSWTSPNDILFDAGGSSMDLTSAVGDQSGKVHLVLQLHNNVYYSRAFLSEAGSSFAWSTPVLLGEKSRPPSLGLERVSSIATNSTGDNIVVIYSGSQDGNGLYFVDSFDGGNSWTDPYPVYLAGNQDLVVADPKLYLGETGIIHAVWATRNKDGFGGPGYYANYNPVDNVWSEPMELDVPGIIAPSVIENDGNVFVSYIHQNINANLWRQSIDGGKTWTSPNRLSPRHVGSNGLVSFIVDSNDTLHAFFGQRIDAISTHGMWHTTWTGYSWTSPEAVVKGPKIKDSIGGEGFDPQGARAVIVNGNVALVTWCTDGSSGTNGAWYSYKRLDAPELPALPLPVPSVTLQSASTEDVLPIVTATIETATGPKDIPGNYDDSPPSSWDPQASILIGVLPAFLLLAGIIFLSYVSRSRNK